MTTDVFIDNCAAPPTDITTPLLQLLLPCTDTPETTKMSAIESCLPKADSPLFHTAVEEVASLWGANPSASYEQVLYLYLVNSLMLDDDSWYDQVGPSVSSADMPEEEVPYFVPNVVSSEVASFLKDSFPKTRVPDCRGHNTCSDSKCTFFHGPVCAFHAGQNTDNRRRLPNGAPNPRFGKPMLCGKGASCPFDHASAELRASREMAVLQQNRLRFAPALSTEADLIAFGLEWRFADVFTYDHLSSEKMDLLEICLDRSALPLVPLEGGFSVTTNDFMDARFAPAEKQMEVVVPLPPVTEDAADGWTTAVRRR
jgi:hypothetical protein